jgi:hypothetical protein
MNAAEKGERYARTFRKVGTLLGKGDTERAVSALNEGLDFARAQGDAAMVRRFEAEIASVMASNRSSKSPSK